MRSILEYHRTDRSILLRNIYLYLYIHFIEHLNFILENYKKTADNRKSK